jgi:DNA-binding MarR family transcriptional regulator
MSQCAPFSTLPEKFQEHVAFQIHYLHYLTEKLYAPPRSYPGLKTIHILIVRLLESGGLSQKAIAGYLNRSQSVTGIEVNRLVKHGLIQRNENPTNRRENIVTLTGDGAGLARCIVSKEKEFALRNDVDVKEFARVAKTLTAALEVSKPILQ